MLINLSNITTDILHGELMQRKNVSLSVLRLDKIHPVISGNKFFKLHYFLETIQQHPAQKVVTLGGAFSNHLVAAAYACKIKNIPCIGIVRGEKPVQLSHTLQHCTEYGMQLHFISRDEYDKKDTAGFIEQLTTQFGDCIIIPEGGYDPLGAKGAVQIMNLIDDASTHICCAIGTATTLAGLLMNVKPQQQIIGIPVLKGMTDIAERISFLTNTVNQNQLHIEFGYHFGGYAKKTAALINFMNDLYHQYQLPTDFVYTAKMMYSIIDLIENDFFPEGSKIVCIHTGGLQGNLSLQKGTLTFI